MDQLGMRLQHTIVLSAALAWGMAEGVCREAVGVRKMLGRWQSD